MTALALGLAGVCIVTGPGAAPAGAAVPNPNPVLISQWQPCEPNTGVTVVVDLQSLGDHTVKVGCAVGDQPSGAAALTNAGFVVAGTAQYGDNFICRIDDLPAPNVQDCQSTPPAKAYWSYWVAAKPHDAWGYSSVGAGDPNNQPAIGSVEGWAFSTAQGTTVQPRLAAVDGTGPATHQPAPLSAATQSIAVAQAWLDPATRALVANAGDALPVVISPLVTTALARLQAGASAGDVADLASVIRAHAGDYISQDDPGTKAFLPRYGARLLLLLTMLHHPADQALITSLSDTLRGLVIPTGDPADPNPYAGEFYSTVAENGTKIGVALPDVQSLSLQALLAGDGHVPAAAVNALLSQQLSSGIVTVRNCGDEDTDLCDSYGPDDTYLTVADTAQAVLALTAVRRGGTAGIIDGTVDATRLDTVITKAAGYLRTAQHTDGGFTGSYPGSAQSVWLDGRSAGYETVLTTSTAAQALAAAGQDAAAFRAARWIAAVQLTDNTHAPDQVRGLVAPDPNLFASYVVNGLGYNPLTVTNSRDQDTQLQDLAFVQIADTAVAVQAWAVASFRDAAITSVTSSAVTTTSATITVALQRGTDPQQVTITYGTPSATKKTTAVSTIAAGSGAVTVTIRLSGLRPATTYTYQATSSGGGRTTVSDVASFGTRGTPVVTGAPADLRAAVAYLTGNLTGGNHYESAPGFPDIGLSIDGAFALAAAHTRGVRTGDPALHRITTFVLDHADAWTGIASRYATGGSLAKMALLAEVLGQNPRAFDSDNLIAALDSTVCSVPSRAPDTRCAATGNYGYAASVFSQALGVIAQVRADDSTPAARPIAYLESLQNTDGGFPALIPAGTGAPSDVDSTGIAAMALNLLHTTRAKNAVAHANSWLAGQQLTDGGFPGTAGDSTNSTALAVQSLSLTKPRYQLPISNALAFLGNQQNEDGGFRIASDLITDSTAERGRDAVPAAGSAANSASMTRSDVRATTQVVNGLVSTSYATLALSLPKPTAVSTAPTIADGIGTVAATTRGGVVGRTGGYPAPSRHNRDTGPSTGSLAATGLDSLGLLRCALALAAGEVLLLLAGRRNRRLPGCIRRPVHRHRGRPVHRRRSAG